MTTPSRYGWKPQRPDIRDLHYVPPMLTVVEGPLPESVDLSGTIDWVYDQGQEGSCTAQSTTSMFRFMLKKDGLPNFLPSRNFTYYNTRKMEGDANTDAGAQIRDVLTVLNKTGVCSEESWGYSNSTLFAVPPAPLYTQALDHRVNAYLSVSQSRHYFQSCLAAGFPFVGGFTVFESFEGDAIAQTGMMPWPNFKTEKVVGAHAILIVGYDNKQGTYKILNSWGPGWGDKGYFHMPMEYLEAKELSSDFWTIRTFDAVPQPVVANTVPVPAPATKVSFLDVVEGKISKVVTDLGNLIKKI